jgi:prophage antirepressor-like protein
MSTPIVFAFESQALRVVQGEDGEPRFVAADVISSLTLDRKALERLDADEKGVNSIHTPGGRQDVTTVNESGLYNLILGSRKPEAKRFKKWVTSEVLPSIRKTGAYGASPAGKATVSQQLAAHNTRLKLLDRLELERHPEKRRAIHQQLAHASDILGLPTPAIDALGFAEEPGTELAPVAEFWEALDLLGLEKLNHASDRSLIALNLLEVERTARAERVALPRLAELRRALRASRSPRFLDIRTVNSALRRAAGEQPYSMKCWVFERPAQSATTTDTDQ